MYQDDSLALFVSSITPMQYCAITDTQHRGNGNLFQGRTEWSQREWCRKNMHVINFNHMSQILTSLTWFHERFKPHIGDSISGILPVWITSFGLSTKALTSKCQDSFIPAASVVRDIAIIQFPFWLVWGLCTYFNTISLGCFRTTYIHDTLWSWI